MQSNHTGSSSSAQQKDESLFFQAMRIGVAYSVIWEKDDLENLLAAVPTKSIGQQAVSHWDSLASGYDGIPRSFRENGVRIIKWYFGGQMSEEDLLHLQQHGNETQDLAFSVRAGEKLRAAERIPHLRNLRITAASSTWRSPLIDRRVQYLAQPSLSTIGFRFLSFSVGNRFANIKELLIDNCHIEDLELGNCVALKKLDINAGEIPGIQNIVLPDWVEEFTFTSSCGVTSVSCGRACRKVDIRTCPDLRAIDLRSSKAFGDDGSLYLQHLESLEGVSMPRNAPQPSPTILTQVRNFGHATYNKFQGYIAGIPLPLVGRLNEWEGFPVYDDADSEDEAGFSTDEDEVNSESTDDQ